MFGNWVVKHAPEVRIVYLFEETRDDKRQGKKQLTEHLHQLGAIQHVWVSGKIQK